MTSTEDPRVRRARPLDHDISEACRRIAPAWPLDRSVAVNPLWGFIDEPIEKVAAEVAVLHGISMHMPRSWFRPHREDGELGRGDLALVLDAKVDSEEVSALDRSMNDDGPILRPIPLITDLADRERRPSEPQRFRNLIVHQISQHAASFFDESQSVWSMDRTGGLFATWRERAKVDRSVPTKRGVRAFRRPVAELPSDPRECISLVLESTGVRPEDRCAYLGALLGDLRGWASVCAQRRFEAELRGETDDLIVELLAIRAAWELLLLRDRGLDAQLADWRNEIAERLDSRSRVESRQWIDWALQRGLEHAYQRRLCEALQQPSGAGAAASTVRPSAQMVFCIDVRSERIRRAIESVSDGSVQTLGFAGFFGMPIEFQGLGSSQPIAQLPALLAPQLRVVESSGDEEADRRLVSQRRGRLGFKRDVASFKRAASSGFTFVESLGLGYAFDLLGRTLGFGSADHHGSAGLRERDRSRLEPVFDALSVEERVDLAERVLRSMSLTEGFAPWVVFAGHGSSSSNNPQAAALDCGACGGQTGETNARLLARLLNEPSVREGLYGRGIEVPSDTRFVAGLHDTTTDDVELFDAPASTDSNPSSLGRLRDLLAAAGARVRRERAPTLGIDPAGAESRRLDAEVRRRSRDWSQLRPEWGLANNAAFVVAPRSRTARASLDGRVFLHEYDWRSDDGFAVLESIMTAPMLVTHWINAQYNASTTDNHRLGSGNKVLHNVVGGTVGVFEGNGGDLRIGLAMQSVHDGERFVHTPLRLSVFLEAPAEPIDDVIERHAVVRNLVDHGWIHLFRLDEHGEAHQRQRGGGWSRFEVERAARS